MTNLEFYKDLILKKTVESNSFNCSICKIKNKKCVFRIDGCPSIEELFNWLCEERKEPIKLKQWEYDLLNFYNENSPFYAFNCAMFMQEKGYFKGIDKMMKLKEILDNCEVEDVNS